jgi:DNA-binding CsgD family transcriptional regulator
MMFKTHSVQKDCDLIPMTSDDILDSIYEAAAFPDRWPIVLEKIAMFVGARGGNFIHSNASGVRTISSAAIEQETRRFAEEGWDRDNPRIGRLLTRAGHPGFLTDRDIFTEDEIRTLPVYRDFLTPSGGDSGAATVIQGSVHDAMVITMEVFPNPQTAFAAIPALNALRPHIARAVMIGSQIQAAQSESLLRAFERAGLSIALLGRAGQVIAATSGFARHFDELLRDGPGRLRIIDGEGDSRLGKALAGLERQGAGASVAVRDADQIGRAILHLVPARLDARDLFQNVWSFAILAHPDNHAIPGADVISALFDLTPAEARVARGIASGATLLELARQWNVSEETIKSQLKRIFVKTSTRRQSDLGMLIAGFGRG